VNDICQPCDHSLSTILKKFCIDTTDTGRRVLCHFKALTIRATSGLLGAVQLMASLLPLMLL